MMAVNYSHVVILKLLIDGYNIIIEDFQEIGIKEN